MSDEVKMVEASPVVAENKESFSEQINSVLKNKVDEINKCKEQAAVWSARGQSLENELNTELSNLQAKFGFKITTNKKKTAPQSDDKSTTVAGLIRSYLEKHGPSRTKDIRKHLLEKGKKTNPGVALSRLVKDSVIKNIERGVYDMAK